MRLKVPVSPRLQGIAAAAAKTTVWTRRDHRDNRADVRDERIPVVAVHHFVWEVVTIVAAGVEINDASPFPDPSSAP